MPTPAKNQDHASAKRQSGIERWQATIDTALMDRRWHEYDCNMQRIVEEFNRHLAGTAGYHSLDWRIIKAMVWTETGGPENRAWRSNPMQIGNPGDPGLKALLGGDEGGDLVLPPEMKSRLAVGSTRGNPTNNIAAGVGYLLMRLAHFQSGTMLDSSDQSEHVVVVRQGDTYSKLAHAHGTTVDTFKRLNPGSGMLSPGKVLKFQKASLGKIIAGWDLPTTTRIAMRYNVGDPSYAKKLDYCLAMIKRRISESSACAA